MQSGPKPGSGHGAIAAMKQGFRGWYDGPAISLTSGVMQEIPFTQETFKDGMAHSTVTDPEDVTVPTAGRYLLIGQARIDFSTGGPPALWSLLTSVRVNGSILCQEIKQNFDNDGDITTLRVADIRDLSVGDVVTLTVTPTFAAGTADVLGTGEGETYLAMERLA